MYEMYLTICSLAVPTATGLERPALCLLLLLGVLLQARCQYPSDSCDYTIWDTGARLEPGVQHLYLYCSAGTVLWRYPAGGGVRLTLQLGSRRSQFQACVWMEASNVTTTLYRDQDQGLERLLILDPPHTPSAERERCFLSEDGTPITLFLETVAEARATLAGQVQLYYDLERIHPKPKARDDMEDCRPCTDKELLHAVCSADFVVSGTMDDLIHREEHEETEVMLQIHGILRQSHNIFTQTATHQHHKARSSSAASSIRWTPSAAHASSPRDQLDSPTSGTQSQHVTSRPHVANDPQITDAQKQYGGSVIAHHKCGIRLPKDKSEVFLFLGRVKLKRARLQCAPRLDEFYQIWEKAVREGENACLLD